MACHPEPTFTATQEARVREIAGHRRAPIGIFEWWKLSFVAGIGLALGVKWVFLIDRVVGALIRWAFS